MGPSSPANVRASTLSCTASKAPTTYGVDVIHGNARPDRGLRSCLFGVRHLCSGLVPVPCFRQLGCGRLGAYLLLRPKNQRCKRFFSRLDPWGLATPWI